VNPAILQAILGDSITSNSPLATTLSAAAEVFSYSSALLLDLQALRVECWLSPRGVALSSANSYYSSVAIFAVCGMLLLLFVGVQVFVFWVQPQNEQGESSLHTSAGPKQQQKDESNPKFRPRKGEQQERVGAGLDMLPSWTSTTADRWMEANSRWVVEAHEQSKEPSTPLPHSHVVHPFSSRSKPNRHRGELLDPLASPPPLPSPPNPAHRVEDKDGEAFLAVGMGRSEPRSSWLTLKRNPFTLNRRHSTLTPASLRQLEASVGKELNLDLADVPLKRLSWQQHFQRRLFISVMGLCVLFYLQVISVSVASIACSQLPQENGSVSGSWRLLTHVGTVCYSGEHVLWGALSWTVLVLYGVGFPLFCLLSLRKAFSSTAVRRRQTGSQRHPGHQVAAVERMMTLGLLFQGLCLRVYWFWLLEFSLSCALAVAATLLTDPFLRMFVAGVATSSSLAVLVFGRPFQSAMAQGFWGFLFTAKAIQPLLYLALLHFRFVPTVANATDSNSYFFVLLSATGLCCLRGIVGFLMSGKSCVCRVLKGASTNTSEKFSSSNSNSAGADPTPSKKRKFWGDDGDEQAQYKDEFVDTNQIGLDIGEKEFEDFSPHQHGEKTPNRTKKSPNFGNMTASSKALWRNILNKMAVKADSKKSQAAVSQRSPVDTGGYSSSKDKVMSFFSAIRSVTPRGWSSKKRFHAEDNDEEQKQDSSGHKPTRFRAPVSVSDSDACSERSQTQEHKQEFSEDSVERKESSQENKQTPENGFVTLTHANSQALSFQYTNLPATPLLDAKQKTKNLDVVEMAGQAQDDHNEQINLSDSSKTNPAPELKVSHVRARIAALEAARKAVELEDVRPLKAGKSAKQFAFLPAASHSQVNAVKPVAPGKSKLPADARISQLSSIIMSSSLALPKVTSSSRGELAHDSGSSHKKETNSTTIPNVPNKPAALDVPSIAGAIVELNPVKRRKTEPSLQPQMPEFSVSNLAFAVGKKTPPKLHTKIKQKIQGKKSKGATPSMEVSRPQAVLANGTADSSPGTSAAKSASSKKVELVHVLKPKVHRGQRKKAGKARPAPLPQSTRRNSPRGEGVKFSPALKDLIERDFDTGTSSVENEPREANKQKGQEPNCNHSPKRLPNNAHPTRTVTGEPILWRSIGSAKENVSKHSSSNSSKQAQHSQVGSNSNAYHPTPSPIPRIFPSESPPQAFSSPNFFAANQSGAEVNRYSTNSYSHLSFERFQRPQFQHVSPQFVYGGNGMNNGPTPSQIRSIGVPSVATNFSPSLSMQSVQFLDFNLAMANRTLSHGSRQFGGDTNNLPTPEMFTQPTQSSTHYTEVPIYHMPT